MGQNVEFLPIINYNLNYNMKKLLLLLVFITFAVSSFAMDLPNRSIFIEGTAAQSAQRTFFMTNFRMEASALGFNLAATRAEAGYIFKYDVQPFSDAGDPSIKNIILITLIDNEFDAEMVSFGWPFGELEDMYEFNQFVFFRAVVLIPGISEEELTRLAEAAQGAGRAASDDRWRNKWIYLRTSLDYPVTFYALQSTGLVGGQAVYEGLYDAPGHLIPLDHIVVPRPGVTIGAEVQFLNYMSLGLNFQVNMGDAQTKYADFIGMAVGAELQIPLKFFKGLILDPYLAFTYPINTSDVFSEFPPFIVGGGLQVGVKGGNSGIIFFDANFMTSLTDVKMKNQYGDLAPNPSNVHYKRFVFGVGAGYKHGFLDRGGKKEKKTKE